MRYKIAAILALSLLVVVLGAIHWRSVHGPAVKKPAVKKVTRPAARVPAKVKPALPAVTRSYKNPRVAIVMDDLGYNKHDLDALFAIGQPITLSILPGLAYSGQTAALAKSNGYQTLLHLPLEPKDESVAEEPGTIRCDMDTKTVLSLLARHIDDVPGISGVSNHMGSKATEDKAIMGVIMGYLSKSHLYFFDSLTSQRSVCRDEASGRGVKYVRRDIFLDIPNDPAYIEKQMLALRRMAFSRGRAIAVCHYRKNTITVLARMMPEFARDGIVFVPLSEMVK